MTRAAATTPSHAATPPLAPHQHGGWDTFWRSPTLVVARHTLASYARSGWLWGEAMLVLVLFVILFDFPGSGDAGYFFGMAGRVLGAESVLGTAILVFRGLRAGAYLPLAHLTSRAPYIRGLTLAACVLRVPLYLLLLALYIFAHGLPEPGSTLTLHAPTLVQALPATLYGSLGLLANMFVVAALTAALVPPVGTRREIIYVLAWLVLALAARQPLGLPSPLALLLQLPLLPLVQGFALGISGTLSWATAISLLCDAALVVALAWLAELRLARRDLLLG
jgi:hypothetical protein